MLLSAVLLFSACRRDGSLSELPAPERAAEATHSLVVLYYRPDDCFTCFGVLGHWIDLERRSGLTVWLAFDEQPTLQAESAISKLRLPFRTGMANGADEHSGRPKSTVKEVLFVKGLVRDSALIRLGETRSDLVARLQIGEQHP